MLYFNEYAEQVDNLLDTTYILTFSKKDVLDLSKRTPILWHTDRDYNKPVLWESVSHKVSEKLYVYSFAEVQADLYSVFLLGIKAHAYETTLGAQPYDPYH